MVKENVVKVLEVFDFLNNFEEELENIWNLMTKRENY